jgi:hypothetical protein
MSKTSISLLLIIITLYLFSFGACYESFRVCEDCDVYIGKTPFLEFHYWGKVGTGLSIIASALAATVFIVRFQRQKFKESDISIKPDN